MVTAAAETPVLWPPHAKSSLIGKDSDARRDWGKEEKGKTENEMVGNLCFICFHLLFSCFFGRNDAKAETPVFWPPHAKS